jgi:Fibronectin type III domain.
MKISDKYRKSVPLNVTLLDHTNKSLTIAWDFIPEATSYTVQLLGSPDDEMPLHAYVASAEDYYEFSNLEPRKGYYARVRANFPYSATSDWVYVKIQRRPGSKADSLVWPGGAGF